MTTAQKIIKYFALFLATCIIFSIISSLFFGTYFIVRIFGLDGGNNINSTLEKIDIDNFNIENIKYIDIELSYTNLTVKNGEKFSIETNNKHIETKTSSNKLVIRENTDQLIKDTDSSDMILYLPDNFYIEKYNLSVGAGKTNIENIYAQKIDLSFGAGKVTVDNINITSEASIHGGAGEILIKNGFINNLDLNIGIGKATFDIKLAGESDIDGGIGEINFNINGNKEDFSINIDKGIGSIKIDNEEVQDEKVYGKGINELEIESGIGNINIDFYN